MGADSTSQQRVVGNTEITQLADKRAWSPSDGVTTFRRFAGTADAIRAKFNEIAAATSPGIDELSEEIDGASGTLIGRIIEDSGSISGGNTEELNAVWELYASPIMKPIEAHTDFDGVTATRKRAIEKAARDGETIASTSTAAEKKLYAYYSDQVLEFMLTELELRKSIILSSRSAIVASYADMNRVVTLTSIAPPTTLIGVLTSLPKMAGTSGSWEWLKLCPQTRQIAKQKYQLTYAWRGAERWAEIYGGTWSPTYA